MKNSLIVASLVIAVIASAGTAFAQTVIPPGGSLFNPPPPPPLPGPKITVPEVPKFNELPARNYLPAPQPSFSDKITTCLEEGAAGGLGPSDREAYSRSCANSR